ncbi:MAG: AbrB family transcriptional regulator [Veillonellales bacterium]
MFYTLLETILVAVAGGFAFCLLNTPIPWTLGPLVTVVLWMSLMKRPIYWPVLYRNTGLIVLGCMMGASFTMETCLSIGRQLPSMLFATIATILFTMVTGYITYRRTDISLASSLLGSTPGGLMQMVLLSEEIADTDATIVTFMQTIRLLSVVFIVPFLAIHGLAGGNSAAAPAVGTAAVHSSLLFIPVTIISALVAARIHFPTPYLVGPVLGTAALVLSGMEPPDIPPLLITIAQIAVGTYMGSTIQPTSLANWKQLLFYALAGGISVVFFSLAIGWLLTSWHNIPLITSFLSTAPGGMAEMGITANFVHADISTITAYQLFRLLFILFLLPPFLKWYLAHREKIAAARERTY